MLSDKIKELMDSNNLSTYRVSKDTGIPYTTLTKILNGTTKSPKIDLIKIIADYFNKPLDHFTEKEDAQALNAPEWATAKDLADIKKILEEDQPVLFDGVPITDENRQRAMDILTGLLWEAKELNKKTYGRKNKATPKDEE
ncbi:helix-turn-helix transcriptional regulator [Paenibacillus sp. OK076]|uniref:helix-turn-helix domain-containing protein n=1 Tax=Paenibacillus sp. OK076 TaxID=1884379 RepID=UPI0008C6E6E8|nr:helix-turn-helix domain-containing protein [Paenibacillus sp. OK076]SEO12316.1 Transcriptional regulator, contains XRE-family HTH domain [Paenibacillus sp. OK076]